MKIATHLHLLPRLRISGAVPFLFLYTILVALAGKTVPLTFVRTYTDMYKSKATFLFNKMQLLKFGIVEDMLEYPFFKLNMNFVA